MLKAPWRAEMLGRITLRCGDDVHARFRERKMVALLALLARQGPRSLTRHELVEALWPDEDADISRNRFRVTLHHLRHLLEPLGVTPGTVLQTGRDDIALQSAAFTSDVNDFVALLDAADKGADAGRRVELREQAVALYRGDFLPGYDDEWARQERDMLARRHFHALRGLSRDLLALKDVGRGLIWARAAIEREPLEEEAYFDLMRLYATDGQFSEALRHYERFQALLARELGARPSLATQKLAEVLQTHLGHQVKASAPETLQQARQMERAANAEAAPLASASRHQADFDASAARTARDIVPTLPALPVRLTRFFGREHDIAALCALLAPPPPGEPAPLPATEYASPQDSSQDSSRMRLVTLLGPGGMGKTRLALEVGERLSAGYAGRVWFVGMEDAVSPRQLEDALQSAMRLPSAARSEPFAQALAVLNQAPGLLILDNLEHLLPEISPLILHLLTNASGLRCLATSRRGVGLEGEREYALGPLGLPEPDADPSALREYAGVALFLDRARARRSDFALTAHNAPDILRLCRLLEGLPLALELAAARIRVMSAREMCAQFTEALEWLVDARGGKEARHRSLRAAITWSHRMLSGASRRCWHLCSVFAGGFTSDMAVWMCAPVLPAPADVLLTLDELCGASLLTAGEDNDGATRFAMLESLRVFAGEQLEQSGEAQDAQTRHLEWFARRMRALSGDEDAYFAFAQAESANLRAALAYGLSERAAPDAQKMAAGLAALLPDSWRAQGSLTEGREWLRQALCMPAINCAADNDTDNDTDNFIEDATEDATNNHVSAGANSVFLAARVAAARVAAMQGDYAEADALAERVMLQAQHEDHRLALADSRYIQGLAAFNQGRYPPARAHMMDALALYRALGAAKQQAECLSSLGIVAWYQGDHAAALLHVEDALHRQRARNSRRGIAACLLRMGNIVRDRGDLEAGKPLLLEALQTYRDLRDTSGVACALHDLGVIALFQGDEEGGRQRFEEAGKQFYASGLRHGHASCLHNLGRIEISAERWEAGRARMQEALDAHREMGDRRGIAAAMHNLAEAAQGMGCLSEARDLLLESLTMDREMGSRVSVAQHLHRLADVHHAMGQQAQAAEALREALAIYRTVDVLADMAGVLLSWALLRAGQGQAGPAARMLGAVQAYRRTIAFAASPRDRRDEARAHDLLRSKLGDKAFEKCRRQGEALSLEQAADEVEQMQSLQPEHAEQGRGAAI